MRWTSICSRPLNSGGDTNCPWRSTPGSTGAIRGRPPLWDSWKSCCKGSGVGGRGSEVAGAGPPPPPPRPPPPPPPRPPPPPPPPRAPALMFPDERAELMLELPRLLALRVCAPPLELNAEALRVPLMSRLAELRPPTSRFDTSPRWIDSRPASARPRKASRDAASAAWPRPYCCETPLSRYGTAPRCCALWFQFVFEMLVRLKLLYRFTLTFTSPPRQLALPQSAPPTITPAVKPSSAPPATYPGG